MRRERCGRTGGFTLLEVMVAIVITAVVALLAFGTLSTALDGEEQLQRHQETAEAQMIVRALLMDALRHPPEEGGAAMNEMLFEIEDGVYDTGLPADAVRFRSRGLAAPLGATGEWTVELAASPEGLRLLATPGANSDALPIEALILGALGLDVRALARLDDGIWSEQWESPGRVPAAVALAFLDERGQPVAPALVVRGLWEGVP
jgi:prepilin-type N-terminal cleavage/methylation domain-containing protein